jgi:hypothetical protein
MHVPLSGSTLVPKPPNSDDWWHQSESALAREKGAFDLAPVILLMRLCHKHRAVVLGTNWPARHHRRPEKCEECGGELVPQPRDFDARN